MLKANTPSSLLRKTMWFAGLYLSSLIVIGSVHAILRWLVHCCG